MAERGAFIVFEGIDRAGKTSQTKALVERLTNEGYKAKLYVFPDRTTQIGGMINGYLKSCSDMPDNVIHLLYSANRWEKKNQLMQDIEDGYTIIADRYAYSGVVFTAAKKQETMEWCKLPDVGLPAPDLVVFLDMTVEDAAKRGEYGEERYETLDFQTEVHEQYKKLMQSEDKQRWNVVDANRDFFIIAEQLLTIIEKEIERAKTHPLGKLWNTNNE